MGISIIHDASGAPIRTTQRSMAANNNRASPSRAPYGPVGDAQYSGNFLLGHAGEIAHLHHLHRAADPRSCSASMASLIWMTSSSPALQILGELGVERQVYGVTATALRLALRARSRR